MECLVYLSLATTFFIWLFIRDCQLDHKRYLEQNRKGNLHALKEFHQHFKENGIIPEHDFAKEITFLENQSFEVRIIDYFSLKQY